ncbi:MAG: hypothetical protein OXU79_15075 [Gemmatimonadota bacterium]|nr:hypothetical protein [Gemmatimonadota bacterium]
MSTESRTCFSLDAAALEVRGQFDRLRFCERKKAIVLDDMFLVEDDAPAIGRPRGAEDRSWFEKLHEGVLVRKDLVLDDPRATAAYLVFNGREMDDNDHALHISVNGHHLIRPPSTIAHPAARQYYTSDWGGSHFDNWFVVAVPVGALRQGTNEFVLWAESKETSWEIMVAADGEYKRGSETRLRHPDRSAKSRDAGRTWDFKRLGWKDEIDGEYVIRLSLDRSAPQGAFVSPVIDLATGGDTKGIGKLLELEKCRVGWEVDVPEGSEVRIEARLGDHPAPGAARWSPFESVTDFSRTWNDPAGRYLQFKMAMCARNPLVTPVFKGISVEARRREHTHRSNRRYHLHRFRNGRVIRPSLPYVHEDFARLNDLRNRFELDSVISDAATEFEAQLKLMHWAYKVPIGQLDAYRWNYLDLPRLERDANGRPGLLGDYQERRRDGHCLYCNLTLIAACLSMGFPARWVNISTKHTYGHEVAEVWSNEFDKWIFLDATRDYYIYDPDTGIPLGLVEISERLAEIMPGPATWEYPIQWRLPDLEMLRAARVAYRQGDNAFSIDDLSGGPEHLMLKGHLQMVRRNDFASRPWPLPWRLSSNWGSDLFYCFYSDVFPRKREYHEHTTRWQDFSPPLNRTELFLSETAEPDVLRVDADTETPCFDAFLVKIDGDEWRKQTALTLEWRLHEGLNQLRVMARNSAGVCGPESHAEVVMIT